MTAMTAERHVASSSMSTTSGGELNASRPSSQPRIAKSLHVDVSTQASGVRWTLYAKVSLPLHCHSTPQTHHFLSLTPFPSHLIHHSTYSLPLRFSLMSSSTDALLAAEKLGLPLLDVPSGAGGQETEDRARYPGVGRAQGRKASGVLSLPGGQTSPLVRLKVDGTEIHLEVEPSPPRFFDGRHGSANGVDSSLQARDIPLKGEWIVVMRLETNFGGLTAPRFANTVGLPLPLCLRDTMSFTHGNNEESQDWDVAIRPALSQPALVANADNIIRGSFLSTTLLHICWAPRSHASVAVPQLAIERSTLDVKWTVAPDGSSRAVLDVKAVVLQYTGLRDRVAVQLGVLGSTTSWAVISVEGDAVAYETPPFEHDAGAEPSRPVPALKEGTETPPRRPRPRKNKDGPTAPRPPSFTSLFDTPPPVAPIIDDDLKRKLRNPSLLGTVAPFQSESFDADAPGFELDDQLAQAEHWGSEADESASESLTTHKTSSDGRTGKNGLGIVDVVISSVDLLVPSRMPHPTCSFQVVIDFEPPSSSSKPLRLPLPTFSVLSSPSEDVVSTVSAGTGSRVELISMPSNEADQLDSPLPGMDGKARWATCRRSGDGRLSQSIGGVEVEVTFPVSRPTSLLLLEEPVEVASSAVDTLNCEPSLPLFSPSTSFARRRKKSTRSKKPRDSVRSIGQWRDAAPPSPSSSTTSLVDTSTISLVKIRITPVPPARSGLPSRLYTHLSFALPFEGELAFPIEDSASSRALEVSCAWDGEGQEMELDESDSDGTLRVSGKTPMSEVLYQVESRRDSGDEEWDLGEILPMFPRRVAELEVDISSVTGYTLDTSFHGFDSCTASVSGQSTMFKRFLISPYAESRLRVSLTPLRLPSKRRSRKAALGWTAVAITIIAFGLAAAWSLRRAGADLDQKSTYPFTPGDTLLNLENRLSHPEASAMVAAPIDSAPTVEEGTAPIFASSAFEASPTVEPIAVAVSKVDPNPRGLSLSFHADDLWTKVFLPLGLTGREIVRRVWEIFTSWTVWAP